MLSFISRQSNKKISVIELFPIREKQKNASSNNFTTQTKVKKNFDHVQCKNTLDGWLVALIV